MPELWTDPLVEELSRLLVRELGLYFPRERWDDLKRGFTQAAGAFGYPDVRSCLEGLTASPLTRRQIEILADHLTNNETYFFREERVFKAFTDYIVPALTSRCTGSRPRLQIWSAGCASGEEPYSISILLNECLPRPPDWQLSILATDISPTALRKAEAGLYPAWSFRECPAWIKSKYFSARPSGCLAIDPLVKQPVVFAFHNLSAASGPPSLTHTGPLDVIFCRNVLMYFAPETVQSILVRFYHSLAEDGWLILNSLDAFQIRHPGFSLIEHNGVILYTKKKIPLSAPPVEDAPPFTGERKTRPDLAGAAAPQPSLTASNALSGEASPVSHPSLPVSSALSGEAVLAASRPWLSGNQFCPVPSPVRVNAPISSPSGLTAAGQLIRQAGEQADQGQLSQALELCRQAVSLEKLNPAYHFLTAVVLLEMDRLEEVESTLKKVVYLDPDFVMAHFVFGHLALRRGELLKSRKHFTDVITLLDRKPPDEVLNEAGGITAARLREIVDSITRMRNMP